MAEKIDNWKNRSASMCCETCMHFVPKTFEGNPTTIGRCRKHCPVVQEGWPVVFTTDWCGDHKLNEATCQTN